VGTLACLYALCLLVPVVLLFMLGGCQGAATSIPAPRGAVPPGPPSVGDTAPDFTLPSSEGDQVSLSGLLRKGPVLLYFNMAYG